MGGLGVIKRCCGHPDCNKGKGHGIDKKTGRIPKLESALKIHYPHLVGQLALPRKLSASTRYYKSKSSSPSDVHVLGSHSLPPLRVPDR